MTKDEAIEMLKHCGAENHCVDYKLRNCGGCNQRKAQDMAIEALKTEAIPIEWLKEWAKKEDNFFGGILYASLISTILTDWQLRKEE